MGGGSFIDPLFSLFEGLISHSIVYRIIFPSSSSLYRRLYLFDVVVGGDPVLCQQVRCQAEVHIKSPLLCLFSFYILSCLHRDDDERGSSLFFFQSSCNCYITGSCRYFFLS